MEAVATNLFGSHSGGYEMCCPPVFDPYTLLALLGGIALATFFLQQVIVMTVFGRSFPDLFGSFTNDPNWLLNLLDEISDLNEDVLNENSVDYDTEEADVDTDFDHGLVSRISVNESDSSQMQGQCRSEVWHCMSGVMEGGIKYIKQPADIFSSLTPVLYKAVFHGGVKSMWSSVMEYPEIRRMGECIQNHDNCVEHNILAAYL